VALWRTSLKAFVQIEQEKDVLSRQISARNPIVLEGRSYTSAVSELTSQKSVQVLGIVFVWLVMFLTSFHGLSPCTSDFGIFVVALSLMLVICTNIIISYMHSEDGQKDLKPVDWMSGSLSLDSLGPFTFPTVAFGAGMLGGLLGLGGGVILSPVLLEVGMHSESVQATTALIVFLSSSLASIQFALLQQIVWHYALWYSCITIIATVVGQHLCEVYVRRTGRYSIITLSIAGVLLFSLASLAIVGTIQVIEDVKYGQQMWWSTARLCSQVRFPLFDIDADPTVQPSEVILNPQGMR
jgi:uncharacterized membrane protein YfcA